MRLSLRLRKLKETEPETSLAHGMCMPIPRLRGFAQFLQWQGASSVFPMLDEIRGDFTKKYMLGNNWKCENSWSTVYGRMSKTGAFRAAKRAKRAREEE